MPYKKTDVNPETQRRRDVLNYYLKRRGMDIKTLAGDCGYNPQTIYNMLSKGVFSVDAATKFSKVLLCEPEEIINGVFSHESMDAMNAEKNRVDYETVSDERLWMRTMLLIQQRTIENLSVIAREKLEAGK